MPVTKPYLLVLAGAAVILAGGGAYYATRPDPHALEKVLTLACEEVLMERLRSPATYARESVAYYSGGEPTFEQYVGTDPVSEEFLELKRVNFQDGNLELHQLFLTYDAANGFGTPIRGLAQCTYVGRRDATTLPGEFALQMGVRINGKTSMEWVISQIKG
jgi:hypothetical protein